jgi:hypothetical protein
MNLQEYIFKKLDVADYTNDTDPLLEDPVRISQLIKDMNNVRSRGPFPYSRTTEWVSPSGESLLLDGFLQDSEACVKSIWLGEVFDDNCLPENDDTPKTLANRLENLDMFDDFFVHMGKEEERLNASTCPPPRRCTYGAVHSENVQVGDYSVADLYQYPINNRITKSMRVPLKKYIYDFLQKRSRKEQEISCPVQQEMSHLIIAHSISTTSNLKGGAQQAQGFLPGTPSVSVTFNHQMLFEVYALVDKNGGVTLSTNTVMQKYTKLVSTVALSHGQVLIWQPRYDEIYMHVLRFKKEDTAKKQKLLSACHLFFGW